MSELKKILHADDDQDILAIIEMALSGLEHLDLNQVESGPGAIEACGKFAPDMLLLDYMMPGMTGEEAWDEIRKFPGMANVPTVFLTAKAQSDTEERLLRKGALAVLHKPFDPIALGPRLRDLWDHRIE